MSSKPLVAVLVALLSVVPSSVRALTNDELKAAMKTAYNFMGTEGIIAGVILMGLGLVMCFLGNKFIKICMAAVGFVLGMFVTTLVMDILVMKGVMGENAPLITLLVGLAVGLVFCILFFCFYKLALYALGGFGMVALAEYVIIPHVVTESTYWLKWVLIVVAALIGIVLAHFFEKIIIICGTSIIGAGSFIAGLDVFAKTGIVLLLRAIVLQGEKVPVFGETWAMIAAFIVLALLGMFVQFKFFGSCSNPNAPSGGAKGKGSRSTYAYV